MQKFNIKYDTIIFEKNKEKLHYNTFIDDSIINAQKIFDANKSVFLYNQTLTLIFSLMDSTKLENLACSTSFIAL